MLEAELKKAWLSVSDVALPLAGLRDEYLDLKGGEGRFMRLTDAYSNLNAVEQALFEYLQAKKPLVGKKPDRTVLMMAEAAIENGRILIEMVKSELASLKKATH